MYFIKINNNYNHKKDLLFFIQNFLELTSYKSVESYKSKMMMLITLCEEYEMIFKHEYSQNKEKLLKVIAEEIIIALRQDIVAKSILKFSAEDYIIGKINNFDNLQIQRSTIKLITEELKGEVYYYESIKYLQKHIADSNKNNFSIVLNNTISFLNHIGMKNSFLFHICKAFFEENKDENLESFFRFLLTFKDEYSVYLGCDNMPNFIDEEFFGKKNLSVEILTTDKGNPLKGRKKTFIFKEIDAKNPFDAVDKILEIIDQLKWSYNVFDHSDKINIFNTIVAKDKNGKTYKYQNNISVITHQKIYSDEKMSQSVLSFFEKFSIHEQSIDKFIKAIKLHNEAILSKNPENQLILFWNALETLSVHKNKNSKLENVESFILSFVRKRYFIENFTYIYDNLLLYKQQELLALFQECKLENNLDSLIKIIVLDNYESNRKNFYSKLDIDFPLMIDRIYKLNQDFNCPKNILKKLEKHDERVKQQLARIYRHRNLIVHSDHNKPFINILISNLHNYFDYVLDEIISHSYHGKILNIDNLGTYLELLINQQKETCKEDKITLNNYKRLFFLTEEE